MSDHVFGPKVEVAAQGIFARYLAPYEWDAEHENGKNYVRNLAEGAIDALIENITDDTAWKAQEAFSKELAANGSGNSCWKAAIAAALGAA